MKKLKLANLAKGLNRNEMKSINGGGPSGPACTWQSCISVRPDGTIYFTRVCMVGIC
jgi:hypothetical protein